MTDNSSLKNRLRNRVCGICLKDNQLLMVKLRLGDNPLWIPPGGGIEFGESAADALKREFAEETGLKIGVGELLFVNEFIAPPLHAIEFFFEVFIESGSLVRGFDPELGEGSQIIEEVRFMSFGEIKRENPLHLHRVFRLCNSIEELRALRGYLPSGSGFAGFKDEQDS